MAQAPAERGVRVMIHYINDNASEDRERNGGGQRGEEMYVLWTATLCELGGGTTRVTD